MADSLIPDDTRIKRLKDLISSTQKCIAALPEGDMDQAMDVLSQSIVEGFDILMDKP